MAFANSQTPEVVAKMKTEVNPVIKSAEKALDAWGNAMGSGDENAKINTYLSIKDEMISLFLKYGLTIKEE